MAWRAMGSLLVLRDQANLLAPNRSKASDGLVGDEAHQSTNSDHNPHYVPGVGTEIVTALDLTHDPAHGFDSYWFAEILRRNRDKRIKYVISNHRIFSSYASGSRPAWTWGSYNGIDPHTNHVHISVLDAVISDTRTPWNLEGFTTMALTQADLDAIGLKVWNWDLLNGAPVGLAYEIVLAIQAQTKANGANISTLLAGQSRTEAALARIEKALADLAASGGNGPTQDQVVAWVKQALREGTAQQ